MREPITAPLSSSASCRNPPFSAPVGAALPIGWADVVGSLSYWQGVLDAAIAPERVQPARKLQFSIRHRDAGEVQQVVVPTTALSHP